MNISTEYRITYESSKEIRKTTKTTQGRYKSYLTTSGNIGGIEKTHGMIKEVIRQTIQNAHTRA